MTSRTPRSGHMLLGLAGIPAALLLVWPLLGTPARAQEEPAAAEAPAPAAPPKASGREMYDKAVDLREEANAALAESQGRIEELSDDTDSLLTRYQTALRQHESLRTYNRQMETLIASQVAEQASLELQLDQVELVSRDVTPLMLRMIDSLEAFVELDVPFLAVERAERIADLRELMDRADVSEAEKYRRIMEAYQIENEYGRTIEAYRSTLQQGDREVTVDFLRVGRIALVFQSLDESEAGVWNQEAKRWDPLDGSFRSAIRDGLRIARKQSAPDLIRLPLPAPEKGES